MFTQLSAKIQHSGRWLSPPNDEIIRAGGESSSLLGGWLGHIKIYLYSLCLPGTVQVAIANIFNLQNACTYNFQSQIMPPISDIYVPGSTQLLAVVTFSPDDGLVSGRTFTFMMIYVGFLFLQLVPTEIHRCTFMNTCRQLQLLLLSLLWYSSPYFVRYWFLCKEGIPYSTN